MLGFFLVLLLVILGLLQIYFSNLFFLTTNQTGPSLSAIFKHCQQEKK